MTPENLKELMQTYQLTAKRTAFLAQSSPSTIYMWLRGERNIQKIKWDLLQRNLKGTGKIMVLGDTWGVH